MDVCRNAGEGFIKCFMYTITGELVILFFMVVLLIALRIYGGKGKIFKSLKVLLGVVIIVYGAFVFFADIMGVGISAKNEDVYTKTINETLFLSSYEYDKRIDYLKGYLKEEDSKGDSNVEYKEYRLDQESLENTQYNALDIEDFGGGVTSGNLYRASVRLGENVSSEEKILIGDNNSFLKENEYFYTEALCEDREDVKIEGYLVKDKEMSGLGRGFYNSVIKLPNENKYCKNEQAKFQ